MNSSWKYFSLLGMHCGVRNYHSVSHGRHGKTRSNMWTKTHMMHCVVSPMHDTSPCLCLKTLPQLKLKLLRYTMKEISLICIIYLSQSLLNKLACQLWASHRNHCFLIPCFSLIKRIKTQWKHSQGTHEIT